mmetsp:Transcript_31476/g.94170  ORF Transcript_31476/g.94170 Transcript_31476/m.94170 type:complete len:266 (-) Transcript_31476:54-851(-)
MNSGRKRQRPYVEANQSSSRRARTSNNTKKGGDAGWIAALARDAAVSSSGGGLSKEERIKRRNAKKKRREERKTHRMVGKTNREPGESHFRTDGTESSGMRKTKGKVALDRIAQELDAVSRKIQQSVTGERKKRFPTPWTAPDRDLKGKATSGQKKLTKNALQPRKRDYGGLGLARPSLFLDLHDPSFVPKFEEEFAEHVRGFFGKQRTKAMKKQLDGDMLWRRLAGEKKKGETERRVGTKVGGKKLADMTPDERVEAMMKSGII